MRNSRHNPSRSVVSGLKALPARRGLLLSGLAVMLVAGILIYSYRPGHSRLAKAHEGTDAGTHNMPRAVAQVPVHSPVRAGKADAGERSADSGSLPGHTPREWPGKPFARSLDGTNIDGELRADASGNLIVNLRVKDFFDYFLSAVGEVSPEKAVGEIQKLARASLPPKAVKQAMALLSDYLNYKSKALDLSRQKLSVPPGKQSIAYQIGVLRRGLDRLRTLRRETMPADAVKAFFGAQEAYGDFVVKSLKIQQRKDLSDRQKAQMIANARDQLPPVILHTRQQVASDQDRMQKIQHIEDTAASPDEAAVKLEQMGVSQEQVNHIVDYMNRKARFQSQYQAYARDLKQLEKASLAPEDLKRARKSLLQQYFDTPEEQTWARLQNMNRQHQKTSL